MATINKFKLINNIEGYSYLVLLFIAMPLKYIFGYAIFVKYVGMLHGILYLIFIYYLLLARFSFKNTALYFILAIVPFGTIYTNRLLNK